MIYTPNFFTLDGKSSADFNAWIATSNMFNGAEHDDNTVEIPGRNGAVVFSNGRYKNFTANVSCYIPHGMRENVDGLRSWLSTKWDYVKYREEYRPGEFRLVRYKGGFALSKSDRVGAAFTLKFDCKPQRFLDAGEIPTRYTANGEIYNPTLYTAEPLITLKGTPGVSGAFNIKGNQQINVTFPDSGTIIIDVENGEAYDTDGANLNNNVSFPASNTAQDFPRIAPGSNAVLMWNVASVEIVPRWWTI